MRFRFIEEHLGKVSIERLCQIMNVSARGYRAYRARPMSQNQRTDMVLLAHSQRLQGERIKSLKGDKRQLKMQLDALWQQISTEELRLDSSLKSYIDKLQTKYENTNRAIIRLEYQNSTPLDSFTNIQKHNFADALKTRLTAKGQPKFRKAYLRSLLSHIEVGENVIKISGSSTDLAKLVSNFNSTGKLVPTFEQE